MPLAIRNLETGMFVCKGGWTSNQKRAAIFQTKLDIERAVDARRINKAEMVLLDESLRIVGGIFVPMRRSGVKSG